VKLVSFQPGKAHVELTREDLLALSNALNEVCNALDLWDFETRMGCSRESVQELLKEVSSAYEQVSAPE